MPEDHRSSSGESRGPAGSRSGSGFDRRPSVRRVLFTRSRPTGRAAARPVQVPRAKWPCARLCPQAVDKPGDTPRSDRQRAPGRDVSFTACAGRQYLGRCGLRGPSPLRRRVEARGGLAHRRHAVRHCPSPRRGRRTRRRPGGAPPHARAPVRPRPGRSTAAREDLRGQTAGGHASGPRSGEKRRSSTVVSWGQRAAMWSHRTARNRTSLLRLRPRPDPARSRIVERLADECECGPEPHAAGSGRSLLGGQCVGPAQGCGKGKPCADATARPRHDVASGTAVGRRCRVIQRAGWGRGAGIGGAICRQGPGE